MVQTGLWTVWFVVLSGPVPVRSGMEGAEGPPEPLDMGWPEPGMDLDETRTEPGSRPEQGGGPPCGAVPGADGQSGRMRSCREHSGSCRKAHETNRPASVRRGPGPPSGLLPLPRRAGPGRENDSGQEKRSRESGEARKHPQQRSIGLLYFSRPFEPGRSAEPPGPEEHEAAISLSLSGTRSMSVSPRPNLTLHDCACSGER